MAVGRRDIHERWGRITNNDSLILRQSISFQLVSTSPAVRQSSKLNNNNNNSKIIIKQAHTHTRTHAARTHARTHARARALRGEILEMVSKMRLFEDLTSQEDSSRQTIQPKKQK